MRAFEIKVNGQKRCLAGVGDAGVLTAIVGFAAGKKAKELHLYVGGLTSPSKETVSWIKNDPLHVGDEVEIKLLEVPSVDEPETRESNDPERDLRARQDYVRAMAKDLGWNLEETPQRSKLRKHKKN